MASATKQIKLKIERHLLLGAGVLLLLALSVALWRYASESPVPVNVSGSPTGTLDYRVNLDTADAATLELLPGIGRVSAAAIVKYRTQHGPFKSLQEIQNVPGIGPVRANLIRPYVTLSNGN